MLIMFQREKEREILHPQKKSKKQRDNIKNATKNFDYTTIADRLTTVSWVTAVTPLVW